MFEKIEKNYIEKGLANFDGIDNIKRFFKKATKEQDLKWIIKAYTVETDFYKILNREIAGSATQSIRNEDQHACSFINIQISFGILFILQA
jgi:hypothetical protein